MLSRSGKLCCTHNHQQRTHRFAARTTFRKGSASIVPANPDARSSAGRLVPRRPDPHSAGGDATGGQLAVAAPSSSGLAQKIDEQRAVDLADDSDYGLVAGIWITNLARAHRVAAQPEAGQIYVNEWQAGLVEGPFGGYKNSDYGRENGMEALHHYTQTNFVAVRQ
jgi:hypothetical protein